MTVKSHFIPNLTGSPFPDHVLGEDPVSFQLSCQISQECHIQVVRGGGIVFFLTIYHMIVDKETTADGGL